jgi:hypothetical protein
MSVSIIVSNTLDSVSLNALVESTAGISCVTGAGTLGVLSFTALQPQVGISPPNAGTDRAHVKASVASVRFIDVDPF